MKKILKWIKRILISIIGLIIVLMIGLYVTFFFWKKDAISDLPKNSLVIDTDKGQVEYTLTGNSDKYMLFVHGSPGSVFVEESKPFVDKGFTVLAISRPGYYKTPLTSGETPREQAALYKSLLNELKIDSIYVNGLSGGGPSSIQFALDYPERTAGLILRAAVSEKIVMENSEKGLVDSFFETEFGTWLGIQIAITQVDDETTKRINYVIKRGMFPRELSNEGYKNDNNQFAVLKDFPLEKITVPTIILHGNKDDNVPFSFAQNASKRIPNATLFEMKGKDHFVFITSYRDTINNEIIRFVDNIETNKK
jgi:pimeloyl-ACP methyl ester carboxylesterase